MVAEALFNSVIRYGVAVYLKPVFEVEEVKAKSLSSETRRLQVIQNKMLRMIFEYTGEDRINMDNLREKIGMFSVNQINCYHVLLEAFNVIHFGSSEKIQEKWLKRNNDAYSNRRSHNVEVPRVEHERCKGFAWYGAKMWNQLPEEIKTTENLDLFKDKIKKYLWENIH